MAGVRHLTRAPRRPAALARLAAVAAVVTWALGAAPAPALALSQRGHSFGFAFSEKGEGLGQLSGPAGVAVNESTGDVYVVDAGNQRIERFHPSDAEREGEPLAVWGWGVTDGEAKYEICESGCKAGIGGTGEGQLDYPKNAKGGVALKGHERAAVAIAVDNSTSGAGDVYVVTQTANAQNVVEKFSPNGQPLGHLSIAPLLAVGGLSVDASGVVWVQGSENGGEEIEQALVELEFVKRFDPEKNLLSTVKIEEEGALTPELELRLSPCPTAGIAVDAEGRTLYANHERLSLEEEVCAPEQEEVNKEEKNGQHATVSSVTAKLRVSGEPPTIAEPTTAALDREYTTAIAVDQSKGQPSSGDVFLDNQGSVAAFDSKGNFIQRFSNKEQLASAGGAGIAVRAGTGDVYVADFKKNHVYVYVPESSGPPTIDSLSSENLEPTSTKLIALVDPHGKPTQAFFEYGTVKCPDPSCVQTSPKPVGSGFGAVEFTETITGLQPGTTYYFKVIATNESGAEEESVLHTFTTLPKASGLLPDNRAWEMVSPAAKQGAAIEAIGGIGGGKASPSVPDIQAAANGDSITYGANAPTEEGPEGNRAPEAQQILSVRQPGGWGSTDIVTPHFKGEGLFVGHPEEYELFSSDLSLGLALPWVLKEGKQEPPLVPGVEEEQGNIYRRHNFEPGCVVPSNCYEPLITAANDTGTLQFGGRLAIRGGTPDLKHVVLSSDVPLLAGTPEKNLYVWSADKSGAEQLRLVSVLPNGEPSIGVEPAVPGLGVGFENQQFDNTQHAISDDGLRVFWSQQRTLFMRDTASGHTIQVSKPEEGVAEIPGFGAGTARYMTASKDGSMVFFTDTAPLTKGSKLQPLAEDENGHAPTDLYVCEVEGEGEAQKCKLTDLSVDQNPGEDADLTQQILGASEEVTREGGKEGFNVYFVANGALAPGAVKGNCPSAHIETKEVAGKLCNAYLVHFNGSAWEAPRLIAVLSAEDAGDWGAGPDIGITSTYLGRLSSRVSPNGRYLAFMSKRPLTGRDNEDAVSKALDEEVFLYDATQEKLVCASCNPFGAKPIGVLDQARVGEGIGLLADRPQAWLGQTLAGSLPTWTYIADDTALYQSRYLSNEGRLFFNSPDSLVTLPAGEEFVHKENVYEYEPAGLGSCTDPGGCVGLLSSGTSDRESAFLDASEDGSSVFFITPAQLVASDRDQSLDVYDARICSSSSPCIPGPAAQPRPCESSASCQGPGNAAPTFETPSTINNAGAGNVKKEINRNPPVVKKKRHHKLTRAQLLKRALKKCHKIKKHNKRVACERQAHKRYGPKKSSHRKGRR
jgi:DNA-binding beta-propeller fold protein YncE